MNGFTFIGKLIPFYHANYDIIIISKVKIVTFYYMSSLELSLLYGKNDNSRIISVF